MALPLLVYPTLGLLLCDLPTPALVVDLTLLRQRRVALGPLLGEGASAPDVESSLRDALYLHSSVLPAAERPSPRHLARLDVRRDAIDDGCFLGLGLNNHLTGGYYWGRCSGPGAAMPAPGVGIDAAADVWLTRESNSNDGKRSEWAEFLRAGDQVQLVPGSACRALAAGTALIGVRRDGVPPGAEPRVEALWSRAAGGAWAEARPEQG